MPLDQTPSTAIPRPLAKKRIRERSSSVHPAGLHGRQANANRRENQMTRTQLEQQREGVEAQIRWTVLHGGDQELLDLLRIESDRLCVMIGQCRRVHGVSVTQLAARPRFKQHESPRSAALSLPNWRSPVRELLRLVDQEKLTDGRF
jgi:hypothetical protein